MFKKKNLLTAIVACGVLSVALPGMSVMASDDEYPFAFRILPYQENGYAAEGRYRQTKSINNPWKVRMTDSTEDYEKRSINQSTQLLPVVITVSL